jgi:twitching motility protein PilT
MSLIKDLLTRAVSAGASDLHIKANAPPYLRVHGILQDSGFNALSADEVVQIVAELLPDHLDESYRREHEADFSYQDQAIGRFRVNIFASQGLPALAIRHVRTAIPTFEELRLPVTLKSLAHVPRGIIVLSGTTGSGKSTTLAAIIGEINRTQRRRIVTVEDPVEYLFTDELSIISQREVGLDTLTFEAALKHLMRQDPDVILIGEMRDPTSIRTGLLAAETGHLVLSTLHAGTADLAVSRILDVFPASEHDQIRMAIAANLKAVVCQRLVPDVAGVAVPAVEVMVNTSTVRKLIEENKLDVLSAAVETGKEDGMQNFNQSVYQLIKEGTITEEEGMRFATTPEALRMNLKGIFLDEGRRILAT